MSVLNINGELCRALGVDPSRAAKVTVVLVPGDIPRATVEVVTHEDGDVATLADAFKHVVTEVPEAG